jgi:hypothetical protein
MMNAMPETSDKPLMLTLRGVPCEPKPGFKIASSVGSPVFRRFKSIALANFKNQSETG